MSAPEKPEFFRPLSAAERAALAAVMAALPKGATIVRISPALEPPARRPRAPNVKSEN